MRTTDRTAGLQTRKAFVWQEETPPRLADLLAGGDRRRDFWRYWVRDTLRDVPKRLSHYGLRPLPDALLPRWAPCITALSAATIPASAGACGQCGAHRPGA